MKSTNGSTSGVEELLLRIFKFVIIGVMIIALLISVLSLIPALYFYLQQPTKPSPAQPAPNRTVDINEFIKNLQPEQKKPQEKEESKPPSTQPAEPEKPKVYLEQSKKIIACLKASNDASGVDKQDFSDDIIEDFRKNLERIAQKSTRGTPYVDDSVRVTCAILGDKQVIDLRKKDREAKIFIPAVNYHIKKWDEIQDEIEAHNNSEKRRISTHINEENERVEEAKGRAKMIAMVSALAFAVFMAIALYLIVSAIESNLRRISASLKDLAIASNHTKEQLSS